MKSEDYKKIGEKCGIEVSYASWDEDQWWYIYIG